MIRRDDTHAFCTDYARAEGEPLAGTGTHPHRNILIRWPKSKWRHSLRLAGGMAGPLEAAVERAFDAGWRVNLIDRKPYNSEFIRTYLFPEALAFDLTQDELIAFLSALPQSDDNLNCFRPRPIKGSLLLCCTHGKHDRCCAKFGFAAYKAIAAAAGGSDDLSVWETTHLGGCRLSASVLALPQMHKYGRVWPRDASDLVAATRKGLPYLPCYRGASHLSPPEQVAELAVFRVLAEHGSSEPATISLQKCSDAHRSFAFQTDSLDGIVDCTENRVATYGNCDDLGERAGPSEKKIWAAEVTQLKVRKV